MLKIYAFLLWLRDVHLDIVYFICRKQEQGKGITWCSFVLPFFCSSGYDKQGNVKSKTMSAILKIWTLLQHMYRQFYMCIDLQDLEEVNAKFENALLEIASSLQLSRNILVALITLQSWKSFMQRWMKVQLMLLDAKAHSTVLDRTSKAANNILKVG